MQKTTWYNDKLTNSNSSDTLLLSFELSVSSTFVAVYCGRWRVLFATPFSSSVKETRKLLEQKVSLTSNSFFPK